MKTEKGLTLIELIIFIVIVAIGLVGILSVLNLTVGRSSDPIIAKQALSVAEAMLDEILAKDFQNDRADAANASATLGCTPTTTPRCARNSASDRPNYNDVDDFDTWNQTGVIQQDGSTAPILGSYVVRVDVTAATLANAVPAKLVTVRVSGGGVTVSLSGHRTDYE